MLTRRRLLTTAIAVAAACSFAPLAHASETRSAASVLRDQMSERARTAGMNPAAVFAQSVTVTISGWDGATKVVTMPFGAFLDRLGGNLPAEAAAGGVAGTPTELNAGDVTHLFGAIIAGSGPCPATLPGYTVHESATVPATPTLPPVIVPAGPVVAIEYGGTLKQVRGSYDGGLHLAGGTVLPSVDSGASGGTVPVFVPTPGVGTLVPDSSIDFTGHAIVAQVRFCTSLFGLVHAGFAGGGLFGDGAARFDDHIDAPVVGHVSTPDVP